MLELQPSQAPPALAALFDPDGPAGLRCFGVLAGLEAGKVLLDDATEPSWALVWEATDGTLYPGGAVTAATLERAVRTLRSRGDVLIGYRDGDPLAALLPADPDYVGTVLEFTDLSDLSDLAALVQRVPSGYALRRMDAELLARSSSFDASSHGSVERFLARHLAVCLLHDSTIVCEASSGPSVMGARELGVLTDERFRGRGFATITCAALIQLCAQHGDRTYWNCAAQNSASAAVARKLGYRTERWYHLVAWLKPGA